MNQQKQEGDNKITGLQPEPICMVCFPDDPSVLSGRTSYVNTLPKIEPDFSLKRRHQERTHRFDGRQKEKGEIWMRKRTEARIKKRRRMKNLKCFLFTSVGNEEESKKIGLPSLFEVLETVKDAWPSPSSKKFPPITIKDESPKGTIKKTPKVSEMKNPQINHQCSAPLLNRRFSMPEELIRKYLVCKERTSEDSETNKTVIEVTSSSSSITQQEETVRRKDFECGKTCLGSCNPEEIIKVPEAINFSQQTSDSEDRELLRKGKKETLKRATQKDFYKQGKRIIKVKDIEKSPDLGGCTCRHEKQSSTTASAKEETDDSRTSESLPSSSPFQLPKHDSSSDNLSSESEYILCTCTELTSSKDTSTDVFHSGKSTLSQSVSDKSFSTQDSTVSVNSVSTRGSTVTDHSNSTTPEIERTSAKETTTSPDYSPRTPKSNMYRKTRRREKYHSCHPCHKRTCPKYSEVKHSKNHLSVSHNKCPVHSVQSKVTVSCGTNTEFKADVQSEIKIHINDDDIPYTDHPINTGTVQSETRQQSENQYQWAKLSEDELYLMQQLRHKKFVENHCQFSTPVSLEPGTETMASSTRELETNYNETECVDEPIMIPRYSALPRTLSMIVNTSSGDTSIHNSDSDNQSLVDSLEDQPITHVHKLHFDTKNESKPVRGDVNFVEDTKVKHRQPKGRAFFVSIKDPFGEDEMLENIERIPQPPERIKNKLSERRLNVCAKHHHRKQKTKVEQKTKKEKLKKERGENKENEKCIKNKKNNQEEPKKINQKSRKRQENEKNENKNKEEIKLKEREEQKMSKSNPPPETKSTGKRKWETKDQKNRFSSKIPILVSSRSTSSSPERDAEVKYKQTITRPKITLRREKETKVGYEEIKTVRDATSQSATETTQILEITQNERGLSLQKPQAIIHPSQPPTHDSKQEEKDHYTIPPLMSTLKVPPPFRHTLNRQFLLTQVRRSPITKFRQRFEVIPEEKSSSLSSAEEKNPKDSPLPKFVDVSTSPQLDENSKFDKVQFQSYNINDVPNLIVAKITNKQLETLPYVKNNDNQKIILFSSNGQNSNSSKGRDALIAMNREDFNRLAKGWINFYKLGENAENSDNEESSKESEMAGSKASKSKGDINNKSDVGSIQKDSEIPVKSEHNAKKDKTSVNGFPSSRSEKQTDLKCLIDPKKQFANKSEQVNTLPTDKVDIGPKLNEEVRFHSSNTILKDTASDSIKIEKVQSSLPELRLYSHRGCEVHAHKTTGESLPNIFRYLEDDETDSDSTDYMEPPSPRVPPLCMADFPSDATLSSSDNEFSDLQPRCHHVPPIKYFQVKKRGGTNRSFKENSLERTPFGKKKNSRWSVTVAGTLELSRSVPDLQMRLSFPAEGGHPLVSQSDSGFAEDSNCSKLRESLQDLDFCYPNDSHRLKNKKPKRTGKHSKEDEELSQDQKSTSRRSTLLPDLEPCQSRNTNKVLKDPRVEEKLKRILERKIHAIWPKLQRVIKREFSTESGRLITGYGDDVTNDTCLSVRGNAISLEKKKKPLTMTQRDVTRRQTTADNS